MRIGLRSRSRLAFGIALTAGVALGVANRASAHSEFDTSEVAPGSIVNLHLFVENESSTAGTTIVELRFPQPLVIVELPDAAGWTAEPVEGSVGGEAIGILWSRPTAEPDDDPNLPLTLGPLPATEGRLQFKVVQTFSDGTIMRWIEDWPVGAPEPQAPGPVLDLVNGAPGTIPEVTEVAEDTTIAASTTTESTTSEVTEVESTPALVIATAPDSGDEADSRVGTVIAIAVAAAVLIAIATFLVRRRRPVAN